MGNETSWPTTPRDTATDIDNAGRGLPVIEAAVAWVERWEDLGRNPRGQGLAAATKDLVRAVEGAKKQAALARELWERQKP